MVDSEYKLTYFNLRGIAEGIRLIFAYADVEYDDNRIEKASWSSLKECQPFHKLPVLEVDGKILTQSVAIARFVGKRFGLSTEDPFKEALLESVVDSLRDLQTKFREEFTMKTPEAKKECDEAIEFFFSRLNENANDGFFFGSEPTWIDIYFTGFTETVSLFKPDFLQPYPNLAGIVERIKRKDSVIKYLERRPVTDM